MDLVIPFSMELIPLKIEFRDFLIRHLDAFRVGSGVHFGVDLETSSRSGGCDQTDNHLDTDQRLAAPVLSDSRKETVFDFVPLAGARRKVTDGDLQSGLI